MVRFFKLNAHDRHYDPLSSENFLIKNQIVKYNNQ